MILSSISDNWENFYMQVERFCDEHGFKIPIIIAVSKTKSIENILDAYNAGVRHFGENYAQEFEKKTLVLKKQNISVNWHFIGHLQRGNANKVVNNVKLIHSVDSVKLIRRLTNLNYIHEALVQFNISDELSKFGVKSREKVQEFLQVANEVDLKIKGMMTISNPYWSKEQCFQKFKEVNELNHELLGKNAIYSAGMSNDWQEAILAGATHIRIGSRIFGKRELN
jgi:PLP dependent protein